MPIYLAYCKTKLTELVVGKLLVYAEHDALSNSIASLTRMTAKGPPSLLIHLLGMPLRARAAMKIERGGLQPASLVL
jgi:hypothetical protein